MKPKDIVIITNHTSEELNSRICMLVDFDKEENKWIVQLPEKRILVEETNLLKLTEKSCLKINEV